MGQEGKRPGTVCITPNVTCRDAAGNNAVATPLSLTQQTVWMPKATPTELAGKVQNAIGELEDVVRRKEPQRRQRRLPWNCS